ncbi:ImmA/IrrE family metallo-endopeptidase [Rhizobium laguerreae]|uniref:helix-turn-helix domain-containing protein n=1 Tax=Rhizobium laguerreae TaxID=1076926 RepID=UPI001ECB397E|nr:XRE family transcriptional regulator [Rhizobium laguerreae]MBY3334586.1 ImmA/IrrE family metallo-endopeptidase [Rhizobium laguerreae]
MPEQETFEGERLRLARVAHGLTLDELGDRISATRQYLNQLEQGTKLPTEQMIAALAAAVGVTPRFFGMTTKGGVRPEQCHFRKQRTTPMSVVSQVLARGTLLDGFIDALDRELELPKVSFPDIQVTSVTEIEEAAEETRRIWKLGSGPISSMMRVVENAGAVVSFFSGVSERVDALSIDRPRPMIIRSEAKPAAVRLRFDLAHECAHLIMHRGIETGDKATESQANRFGSAFLLPRSSFIHEFPRGRLLNWQAIFALKLRWKVSAAAIIRRAFDLSVISADQYRTGYIHLSKTGQKKMERYDDQIAAEEPELLQSAMTALEQAFPGAVRRLAAEAGLEADMFSNVSGLMLPAPTTLDTSTVINFFSR